MKVQGAQSILVSILDPQPRVQDLYIVLESHLPFGFCLDELDEQEAMSILIDAGRSVTVQKAILDEIKRLLSANGHPVDWEG